MSTRCSVVAVEMGMLPFGVDPFHAAHQEGMSTVLVTDDVDRYLASPISRASIERHVDEVIIADTIRADAIVAALAGRVQPAGFFSVNDYCVVTVAELAERFALPGLSVTAARNARDKLRSRQRCAAAGVPQPRWSQVQTAAQVPAAVEQCGLPCVVKPLSEAASIGVRLCRDVDEATHHYELLAATPTDRRGQRKPVGVLVEQYLIGYEVSVEVLNLNGTHHVVGVTDKTLGPHPHFVEVGEAFPSLLPAPTLDACEQVALEALTALGHDFGAAHVEVKVTAQGPRLVEVNARMPGGQITRLIHEATGINLPQQVLRLHTGRPATLAGGRRSGAASRCLTSPRGGVLAAVHGVDLAAAVPGVRDITMYARPGHLVNAAESNTDAIGHLIALGATTGEAGRLADAALGQLHIEVRPVAPGGTDTP
jgi:biotin carboxylase